MTGAARGISSNRQGTNRQRAGLRAKLMPRLCSRSVWVIAVSVTPVRILGAEHNEPAVQLPAAQF